MELSLSRSVSEHKRPHAWSVRLNRGVLTLALAVVLGSASLHADTLAYAYAPTEAGGGLLVFDLNTGNMVSSISSSCNACGNLTAFNGNLYGLGAGGLNSINPSNGATTVIGGLGFPNIPLGSTTNGLYFVGWNVPNPNANGASGSGLYSVNPSTGVVTLVGSLGLAQADGTTVLSNSNDSNLLFYVFSSPTINTPSDQVLYQIDTTTGRATLIGNMAQNIDALMYEKGVLWASMIPGGQYSAAIGTINTGNGDQNVVAKSQIGTVQSLAPDPLVASVTVTPPAPFNTLLPQLAFGGGWSTSLYFTNLNDSSASFAVNFIGQGGAPLTIPALNGSSVTINLAAHGSAVIQAPNKGALVQGYATAQLPSGVTGYGVFTFTPGSAAGQEAVVPLSGNTATTSTMIFDETSYTTGVAVVGIGSSATTVSVTAYSAAGSLIGTGSIQLPASGQTAVLLRDIPGLSGVVGQLGSVDFTVSGANVAVLGIRYNGLAFTSVPTSGQ